MPQDHTVQQYDRAVQFLRRGLKDVIVDGDEGPRKERAYMLVPTRKLVAELYVVQDSLKEQNRILRRRLRLISKSASDAANG